MEPAAIVLCLLAPFSMVGVYHLVGAYLRREERSAVATYDKWIRELHDAIHELVDADLEVAHLEARVMDLAGKVPAETSYQAIRRLGLGRQVEAAILSKMKVLGIGEPLPVVEEEATPAPASGAVPFSRRAKLGAAK